MPNSHWHHLGVRGLYAFGDMGLHLHSQTRIWSIKLCCLSGSLPLIFLTWHHKPLFDNSTIVSMTIDLLLQNGVTIEGLNTVANSGCLWCLLFYTEFSVACAESLGWTYYVGNWLKRYLGNMIVILIALCVEKLNWEWLSCWLIFPTTGDNDLHISFGVDCILALLNWVSLQESLLLHATFIFPFALHCILLLTIMLDTSHLWVKGIFSLVDFSPP